MYIKTMAVAVSKSMGHLEDFVVSRINGRSGEYVISFDHYKISSMCECLVLDGSKSHEYSLLTPIDKRQHVIKKNFSCVLDCVSGIVGFDPGFKIL